MGINLIANSLKHCYLASQSNLSMNQILSHLLLAASFSFRFSFLFSFLFCRYVSHGVICLLSFSFSLLVTRSSVVSWRPGSQVISNSWSLSDLCSLSSISFNSSCYHGDKKTPYFPIFGKVLTASSDVRDQSLLLPGRVEDFFRGGHIVFRGNGGEINHCQQSIRGGL